MASCCGEPGNGLRTNDEDNACSNTRERHGIYASVHMYTHSHTHTLTHECTQTQTLTNSHMPACISEIHAACLLCSNGQSSMLCHCCYYYTCTCLRTPRSTVAAATTARYMLFCSGPRRCCPSPRPGCPPKQLAGWRSSPVTYASAETCNPLYQ